MSSPRIGSIKQEGDYNAIRAELDALEVVQERLEEDHRIVPFGSVTPDLVCTMVNRAVVTLDGNERTGAPVGGLLNYIQEIWRNVDTLLTDVAKGDELDIAVQARRQVGVYNALEAKLDALDVALSDLRRDPRLDLSSVDGQVNGARADLNSIRGDYDDVGELPRIVNNLWDQIAEVQLQEAEIARQQFGAIAELRSSYNPSQLLGMVRTLLDVIRVVQSDCWKPEYRHIWADIGDGTSQIRDCGIHKLTNVKLMEKILEYLEILDKHPNSIRRGWIADKQQSEALRNSADFPARYLSLLIQEAESRGADVVFADYHDEVVGQRGKTLAERLRNWWNRFITK